MRGGMDLWLGHWMFVGLKAAMALNRYAAGDDAADNSAELSRLVKSFNLLQLEVRTSPILSHTLI